MRISDWSSDVCSSDLSGVITLGHRDASIPFSYIADASGKPVGYSHDIQLKVVEAPKKELDVPNLQVKYNLVTSQTRIPLVQNEIGRASCREREGQYV